MTITPPQESDVLLDSIEETQRRIESDTRVLISQVSRLRARGIPWDTIGKRLGISRQAAQQRFVRYCAVEYLGEWEAVKSQGKLVYWTRRRSDKTRLTVSKKDDGWWWRLQGKWNEYPQIEGVAGTAAAAKRAAEDAVGAL